MAGDATHMSRYQVFHLIVALNTWFVSKCLKLNSELLSWEFCLNPQNFYVITLLSKRFLDFLSFSNTFSNFWKFKQNVFVIHANLFSCTSWIYEFVKSPLLVFCDFLITGPEISYDGFYVSSWIFQNFSLSLSLLAIVALILTLKCLHFPEVGKIEERFLYVYSQLLRNWRWVICEEDYNPNKKQSNKIIAFSMSSFFNI